MGGLDFTRAKLKHLTWKDQLRRYLDGKEQIAAKELLSPQDCELGKWIYAEGLAKYGQVLEMKNLEGVHRELHALVESIVHAKTAGDEAGAEQAYQKLLMLSDRIVSLLDEVKKKAA
jgi:Chemoreceptor zinc-binding domain